jgi:hypothetical protein
MSHISKRRIQRLKSKKKKVTIRQGQGVEVLTEDRAGKAIDQDQGIEKDQDQEIEKDLDQNLVHLLVGAIRTERDLAQEIGAGPLIKGDHAAMKGGAEVAAVVETEAIKTKLQAKRRITKQALVQGSFSC